MLSVFFYSPPPSQSSRVMLVRDCCGHVIPGWARLAFLRAQNPLSCMWRSWHKGRLSSPHCFRTHSPLFHGFWSHSWTSFDTESRIKDDFAVGPVVHDELLPVLPCPDRHHYSGNMVHGKWGYSFKNAYFGVCQTHICINTHKLAVNVMERSSDVEFYS